MTSFASLPESRIKFIQKQIHCQTFAWLRTQNRASGAAESWYFCYPGEEEPNWQPNRESTDISTVRGFFDALQIISLLSLGS